MNIRLLSTFIIICIFPLPAGVTASAQQPDPHTDLPVMQLIDRAYDRGQISLDQKVLYKFYAGLKPAKLPASFRQRMDAAVKCGTPALLDYRRYSDRLSPSAKSEIDQLLSGSELLAEQTYTSPSGRFTLHYETSGTDAVPSHDSDGDGVPDYVEWTAAAADSSWNHQIATLGYTDPVLAGDPYDIYFRNFNFYGQTVARDNTTYIEIHNTFENFPDNTDPQGDVRGAIKVTVAHELKHAIQFVMNNWSGESDRWAEMDATLMEEVVYDNVNDYYNYLANSSSIFRTPEDSFYPGSYYHVSWALYFEQKHGPDFWPGVWDRIAQNPSGTGYIQAITAQLGGPEPFRRAYIESQLWHYASGSINRVADYGFEEGGAYPHPKTNRTFAGQDSSNSSISIPRLAANYLEIDPVAPEEGAVRITVFKNSDFTGMGLIAYFRDGSSDHKVISGTGTPIIEEETSWQWNDISRIGIVIANGSESVSDSYRIHITSTIPERITLRQNYPNPFNPSTVIPFTLTDATRIRLKVYDVTGRLVATLLDEVREPGYYNDVRFEGSNLASGIYFYRLVTDRKTLTRKMTLIK